MKAANQNQIITLIYFWITDENDEIELLMVKGREYFLIIEVYNENIYSEFYFISYTYKQLAAIFVYC